MITLISITFKIFYAILLTCCIIFLSKRSETNISNNKNLLIYSLSSVAILSMLHSASILQNTSAFSIGILSIYLISIMILYISSNEIKDYLIINFLIVSISLGHILLSLIVTLLYILIDRYYIYIEEYLNFDTLKNDDSEINE